MGRSQVFVPVQTTNLPLVTILVYHNQNGLRSLSFERLDLKEAVATYIYGMPKTDLPLLLPPVSTRSDFLMDSYWLLILMAARCACFSWLRGIADLNREEVYEGS